MTILRVNFTNKKFVQKQWNTQTLINKSMKLTLTRHLDEEQGTLDKDEDTVNIQVTIRSKQWDDGGEDTKDCVDIWTKHSDGAQEVVKLVGFVEGVRQLLDLNKGTDTGHDSEGEDDDLCSVVDPEHLTSELITVLHHEEDDDDDDATNKTQETKEESWKRNQNIVKKNILFLPLLALWQSTLQYPFLFLWSSSSIFFPSIFLILSSPTLIHMM